MARISTYPLDSTINDGDKLIGTDQENATKNFTLSGIAEFAIDKLIDPDATDFHVPVFNQGGARITDSIISQDSVTGTSITVGGDFAVTGGASVGVDLTVEGVSYLQGHVYTNSNVDLGDTALDTIKQNGTLELLGPVKDSTGTKGNTEQVLVSNAQGELVWENYQGSGLEYQAGWDADTNVPDLTSTAPTASDTGKYWVVSTAGTTNLGGITDWSPGDWAIVSQNNENVVFWNKIDNSSVDGAGVTDKLAVWTSEKTLGTAPITINGNDASFAGDILLEEDQEVNFEVGGRVSGGDYLDLVAGNASITVGIDNELQFKTGNSTVVTIDEEQNVGIGITDPKAKLHVDDGNALITNTQNADVKVKRKNGAEVLVRSNSTFGYIGTMDDTQFQIRQNGNPVARFKEDGTILLAGTIVDVENHLRSQSLHVYGGATVGVDLNVGDDIVANGDVSGNNFYVSNSIIHNQDTDTNIQFPQNNVIKLTAGGIERVRIDSSGSLLRGSVAITNDDNNTGTVISDKMVIGWDNNTGFPNGFGYMYNTNGVGLRFGTPTKLILEVNSLTPKIVSWEDHFFKKGIKDKDGSVGVDGQVLSSTGNKTLWIDQIFSTDINWLQSTVRLNNNNTVSNEKATISGGTGNSASGLASTVGGGVGNSATGNYSTVSGGRGNATLTSSNATVCGGKENYASGGSSVVAGGFQNGAGGDYSIVGSGQRNNCSGNYGVISGGRDNAIGEASFSSISGGKNNNTSTFSNAHIVGSNITADRSDTTFVENLSIKSIPTSSVGLPSGSIWSNNGVLNIVP